MKKMQNSNDSLKEDDEVRASLFGTADNPRISIEEKENESSDAVVTE